MPFAASLHSDARALPLADGSVQAIITSPGYWGLRSYLDDPREIGREATLQQWLDNLVACARDWRRVLREDGCLFVNCGDAYAGGGTHHGEKNPGLSQSAKRQGFEATTVASGLKPKDLIGLGWMLAFALRSDGWWLRSPIVWAKSVDHLNGEREAQETVRRSLQRVRDEAKGSMWGLSSTLSQALDAADAAVDRLVMTGSTMPESTQDRPTSAYEMVFLLTKAERYFWDNEAIKVGFADERMGNPGRHNPSYIRTIRGDHAYKEGDEEKDHSGRSARNVWRINPESHSAWVLPDGRQVSHFASFPTELAARCIKAGTSEWGACANCGAPFRRVVKRKGMTSREWQRLRGDGTKGYDPKMGKQGKSIAGGRPPDPDYYTLAWHPTCRCKGQPVPATVDCPKCGGDGLERQYPRGSQAWSGGAGADIENGLRRDHNGGFVPPQPTGEPCPQCNGTGRVQSEVWEQSVLDAWPRRPCLVIDPFGGSGTSAVAALCLGRSAIVGDLKMDYCRVAQMRVADCGSATQKP